MDLICLPLNKYHFAEINKWERARGSLPTPERLFPESGRIVPGKCAILLYKTNSAVGFLEGLITNPEVHPRELNAPIDACIAAIEMDAKNEGIEFLWCSTFIPGIVFRAKKHGFSIMKESYKLITKRLK